MYGTNDFDLCCLSTVNVQTMLAPPRPALVPRSQRWHARTDLLVLGSHYRILVHTDKTGATSPGFLPALTGSTADGYKAL